MSLVRAGRIVKHLVGTPGTMVSKAGDGITAPSQPVCPEAGMEAMGRGWKEFLQ